VKSRGENPFRQTVEREIIVAAGAQWPTGNGSDYVIPLGVPMSPASTNGRYKPIRRSAVQSALASGATQIELSSADGFATGDVVAAFTGSPSTTNTFTATITAVDHDTNKLTVAALPEAATNIVTGSYVEVEENGKLAGKSDCVFLGENIQTRDEVAGVSFPVPAHGFVQGQVEIDQLADNCYDALIESQIAGIDYVPTTPGV
jgi:hypothetical protein